MTRKAPVLNYVDKGIIAPIYKWEKSPGTKNLLQIWIKDPKSKNPFSKPIMLEKHIDMRHIKKLTPMETTLPGVVEEMWFVYTDEEDGLMRGLLFADLKSQLADQTKTIKTLRQQITALENQQKGLTSGAAKQMATMKDAVGDKRQQPQIGGGFGINRFNQGGF